MDAETVVEDRVWMLKEEWDNAPPANRRLLENMWADVFDEYGVQHFGPFIYSLVRSEFVVPLDALAHITQCTEPEADLADSGFWEDPDSDKVYAMCFTHLEALWRWKEPSSWFLVPAVNMFRAVLKGNTDGIILNPADPIQRVIPREFMGALGRHRPDPEVEMD